MDTFICLVAWRIISERMLIEKLRLLLLIMVKWGQESQNL